MNSEIKTISIFGGIIISAVVFLGIIFVGLDDLSLQNQGSTTGVFLNIDDSGIKKAPELVGIEHYLNTTPEKLAQEMENKVVLYDIWTYSCINCIRTLPFITSWDEKYSDEGLLIIGIHSPEFEFEKDPNNVQDAIEKYEIDYPVVMDNKMETWKAFEIITGQENISQIMKEI